MRETYSTEACGMIMWSIEPHDAEFFFLQLAYCSNCSDPGINVLMISATVSEEWHLFIQYLEI